MKKNVLKKELGLFGVFSMSTGAMFSSGFFLLPGLASQYTGSSVFLAYLVSGLLIVPAMLCMAEISTAIPRAGGAYFILDRAYGPLLGTVGGIGTYLALVLKSAFALVGLGEYTSLVLDIPIRIIALVLTILFTLTNILGAKKSSFLQNAFVIIILLILGLIIFDGLFQLISNKELSVLAGKNYSSFFEHGLNGFFTTIGFVFVSYAGLTNIASVAEEIHNPERNIPLGMIMSLIVTCIIYVLGTFLMVSFIDKDNFSDDLTPVATLTEFTLKWIPGKIVLIMIVVSAIAAFSSTGNAGIMSSSRYPLAMARDKLLPPVFGRQNKKTKMPVFSIIVTSVIIVFIILFVSAEGIAKMASAFQLLIFFFLNFAVIVFRSSKIDAYDPGYLAPLYPYLQILGMVASIALIMYLGWVPSLFSAGLILLSVLWYNHYVKGKVTRRGAILHWFEVLGKEKYDRIENEFFHIIKEKGLREKDPFDQLVTNAEISFIKSDSFLKISKKPFKQIIQETAGKIAEMIDIDRDVIIKEFSRKRSIDAEFIIPGVSVSFASFEKISSPRAYIVISKKSIRKKVVKHKIKSEDNIHVFFFIIAPSDDNKLLLRILSRLLEITDRNNFHHDIASKKTPREVKEYLLHGDRFAKIIITSENKASMDLAGKKIKDLKLPKGVLIAIIERKNESITPYGETVLLENDRLTVIGPPEKINEIQNKYTL
ncbi:MAG: amino acid permease [Bacteroidales bacterium]